MDKAAASFPDNLPPGWRALLAPERDKEYFRKLTQFLNAEYKAKRQIFPPRQFILRALQAVDYEQVKVVILGQDPYHGPGQAVGMSFAVPNELQPKPPSLMNIFKEIASDLGVTMDRNGSDLSGWAEQGVLLLNTVLTVRAAQAFSHRDKGWETFTDEIIRKLNDRPQPIIFLLWGSPARKKKELITNRQHLILESAHPSPLSAARGFFGSKPFSKINELLVKKLKAAPIDWAHTVAKS
ncbi:MAG: uracil-DNA glycosylase [Bdellovibrionales bacterium]|nr:uracil-DNA glycosylase [Bdellovibrionales bacterium]